MKPNHVQYYALAVFIICGLVIVWTAFEIIEGVML